MDKFTFCKAARDQFGDGSVLFDVSDFQLSDDVFTAFDFKVSVGENASGVAFVQNAKTPLWEVLRNTGGEFWIDDSLAAAGFSFAELSRLSDDVFEFCFG